VFSTPRHPYTRALLDAAPDPARRGRPAPPDSDAAVELPPAACRFAARCPTVQPRCRDERPTLRELHPGHAVACHFADA